MTSPREPDRRRIRLSPAEDRFLRAYVRRQVLPLLAGVIVVTLALAGLAIERVTVQRESASAAPAPTAAGPEPADLLAAIERLEGDARNHREQESATREKLANEVREAESRLARLEPRIAKLTRELAALGAARPVTSPPAAPAAGTASPSGDVASVQDRLFNLEKRQDREEALRHSFERSVLERLAQAEDQRQQRYRTAIETEKSVLNRMFNAEARLEALEAGR